MHRLMLEAAHNEYTADFKHGDVFGADTQPSVRVIITHRLPVTTTGLSLLHGA